MSYITQADLVSLLSERKLIELTDDNRNGIVDAAIVAKAIADSEAKINGYLKPRYHIPIEGTVPDLIKTLDVDITTYNLYRRRVMLENIRVSYLDAIKTLEQIQKGIIGLDLPPAASSQASSQSHGEVFGNDSVFSRDKLSDF